MKDNKDLTEIEFDELPQTQKGSLAERILFGRVLPWIYDIPVDYLAPKKTHAIDSLFNIGNKFIGGECKCTSMLEKYDAYAIRLKQHEKYVEMLKTLPLLTIFFVDPNIASIFVAPLRELRKSYIKIDTVNSPMIAYNVSNMWKLDYVIPESDCVAMLSFDHDIKTYKYSGNINPEHRGILDKNLKDMSLLNMF